MSAFALPMPPPPLTGWLHRPTERSATTPEVRDQRSEIRRARLARPQQACQHSCDLLIISSPTISKVSVDVTEILTITGPHPHLVCRAHRHDDEALEVGRRTTLPTEAFR